MLSYGMLHTHNEKSVNGAASDWLYVLHSFSISDGWKTVGKKLKCCLPPGTFLMKLAESRNKHALKLYKNNFYWSKQYIHIHNLRCIDLHVRLLKYNVLHWVFYM